MEGRDLAKSFGVPFFESSAKSRINVEEAFYELVRVFFVDFCGSVLHLPLATVYLGQSLLTPSFSGPRNPPSNRHKNQYPCLCSREKGKEERRVQPTLGFDVDV